MPSILGANTLSSGGYDVANSVRLFSNTFLHKTPTGDSNKQVFTFSTWLKRGNLGAEMGIFTAGNDSNRNGFFTVMFADDDALNIQFYDGAFDDLKTNRVFRDVSAWYHIVVAVDSTDGTAANRIKIYVNGVQETSFSSSDYPDQNQNFDINEDANDVYVGVRRNTGGSPAGYYDGYIAEAVLIDGSQLAADQFGEFDSDSGIWKPIDVSGLTFGQNGFYLEYKGVSTGQNSNGLGADTSGNGHHFASSGLAAHDQSTDTCTNNFATLNPLIYESRDNTFAEGNLKITGGNADDWTNKYGVSSIAVSSGKWFVEAKATTMVTSQGVLGIMGTSTPLAGSMRDNGPANIDSGGRISGGGGDHQTGLTNFADGNIAGVAFDADNGTIQFYRNGSTYGNAVSSIASDTYYFVTNSYEQGAVVEFNFGSPPYSESGGNSDANGYGNFSMAVPNGYFALNTKNLAEYG